MQVQLATVQSEVLNGDFASVVLPTKVGQIEVLPGHAPLLTELETGTMRVKTSAAEHGKAYVLHRGFAMVANGTLQIVAERALSQDEIDIAAVQKNVEALRQDLAQHSGSSVDSEAANTLKAELAFEQACLAVKG